MAGRINPKSVWVLFCLLTIEVGHEDQFLFGSIPTNSGNPRLCSVKLGFGISIRRIGSDCPSISSNKASAICCLGAAGGKGPPSTPARRVAPVVLLA